MSQKNPLRRFESPGQAINYFLELRGWTQDDLAGITSRSLKHLNEIIKDKKPVSSEFASLFGATFLDKDFNQITTSSEWLELSTKFHSEEKPNNKVRSLAEIYHYIPVKELTKRGWLKPTDSTANLKNQLSKFFGISTESFDLSFLKEQQSSMLFRKSEAHGEGRQYNFQIWKQRATNVLRKRKNLNEYDKAGFAEILKNVNVFTTYSGGIKDFLEKLNGVGVNFIFLPHLSKTYLDGAAFSVDSKPVVGLTGRFDRLDNFWFTLIHECCHIYKEHVDLTNPNSSCFDDSNGDAIQEMEIEANEFAAEALLRDSILHYFKSDVHYMSEGKIRLFSEFKDIHPSIVVGILAHQKMIPFSKIHRYKETVRNKIPSKYLTD